MNHVNTLENKLKLSKTTSYDGIDKLMHKVANSYGISVVKLHNDFKKVHGEVPDSWIKRELGKSTKKKQDCGCTEQFDILKKPKTPQQIARKHGVKLEYIEIQLNIGIKVESEHTKNKSAATIIALHHLYEDPDYYKKLKTIEKKSLKEFYGIR